MEVLIDNDIIINMARYALWSEFDRLLRGKGALRPYRCLGSARFTLGREKPPSKKFLDDTTKRDALAIVRLCNELPDSANRSVVSRLVQPGTIDAGEAILMEYAVLNRDAVILTGDKRCIRGVATDPALRDIRAALRGRFVQFDRVLQALGEQYGWNVIRAKVCADAARDPSLAAELDVRLAESVARANLQARIDRFETSISDLTMTSF